MGACNNPRAKAVFCPARAGLQVGLFCDVSEVCEALLLLLHVLDRRMANRRTGAGTSEDRLPLWRPRQPAQQHRIPPPTPLKLRGGPPSRMTSPQRLCADSGVHGYNECCVCLHCNLWQQVHACLALEDSLLMSACHLQFEAVAAEVQGNIPAWLQGSFIRNGPVNRLGSPFFCAHAKYTVAFPARGTVAHALL